MVRNRLRYLSEEGKDCLGTLCHTYMECDQKTSDYSEFLFILAHLYLKGLIEGNCENLQVSFYRPYLLRKLKERPPSNMEQISKILYFIDAVQPLQTGKDSAGIEEKVKFDICLKEMKTQMEQYLTQMSMKGNKMFFPRKRKK